MAIALSASLEASFSSSITTRTERVEEALSVLASLGATVVDPESDGLFTPCLRELWPVLVSSETPPLANDPSSQAPSLHRCLHTAVVQMNKAFAMTPGGAASYVVPPEGEHTTDTLIQLSERPEELPVALNALLRPRSSVV